MQVLGRGVAAGRPGAGKGIENVVAPRTSGWLTEVAFDLLGAEDLAECIDPLGEPRRRGLRCAIGAPVRRARLNSGDISNSRAGAAA